MDSSSVLSTGDTVVDKSRQGPCPQGLTAWQEGQTLSNLLSVTSNIIFYRILECIAFIYTYYQNSENYSIRTPKRHKSSLHLVACNRSFDLIKEVRKCQIRRTRRTELTEQEEGRAQLNSFPEQSRGSEAGAQRGRRKMLAGSGQVDLLIFRQRATGS